MQIALKNVRLGLRNSQTRIPFRYAATCLTRCPQVVLEATLEVAGKRVQGFSGDCLPPGWFDKRPGKSFELQIKEMLGSIHAASRVWREERAEPGDFFTAWLTSYHRIHDELGGDADDSASSSGPIAEGDRAAATPLLASFGLSLVERAVMDAMARAAEVSFFEAVRANLYQLRPEAVHDELAGLNVRDWLPSEPSTQVFVRHTVGLGDPLTTADVAADELLNDGFPQTLEQYVRETGIHYFKIKVSNQLDRDLDRLRTIAALVERERGDQYAVTLDGNEQYKQAEEFDALVEAIRSDPQLATLWNNTLLIEQPLDRSIALDQRQTAGIRSLSAQKSVIIDESDGTLDAYPKALSLGYHGVSSKNCKGPVKSLLNLGLTHQANQRGDGRTSTGEGSYFMTGEDLCTVGVVPVQSDLCLIATLGLTHVERNGHHFHPGLSYLPAAEQEAALAAHPDFYERRAGRVAPRLVRGKFEIGSLQCAGFGFDVTPHIDSMQSPEQWEFASLGLDDP